MLNPTIPNVKNASNEELARLALNCLSELEQRGNIELQEATTSVSYFLSDIQMLMEMAEALEQSLDCHDEHLN